MNFKGPKDKDQEPSNQQAKISSNDKIEIIKDLLVGEQLSAIQEEFKQLKSTITTESTRLQSKIETLDTSSKDQMNQMKTSTDNMINQVKKELTDVLSKLSETKLDKTHFIDLFDKVVKNVK